MSVLFVAACYSPTTPAGAPCQPDQNDCPGSQTCELVAGTYLCTTGADDTQQDAPFGIDATADAPMLDASMPLDAPLHPIAFVQATTTKPTAVMTTLALPAAVTSHDAIIVCLNYPTSSGTTLVSVRDAFDNDYRVIVGPIAGDSDDHYILLAADVQGGADTLVVTLSAAPTGGSDLFALEYAGLALNSPFDVSANMTGTGTAMDSGAATTISAPELVLGYAEAANATPGTGFVKHATQSGNIVEDELAMTAGSYSATATTTGGGWTMLMATFRGQ